MHPVTLMVTMLLLVGACVSTQKATFNTLYSLEHSTTAAYDTYVYGVIRGQWKTNDVPTVSQKYDQFQIGMRAAVELAQFDYQAFAPSNVTHLATIVTKAILEAKAR